MNESGTSISIHMAKGIMFPAYSYTDWLQVAEKALKNLTIKELHSKTSENIHIKPLYVSGDVEKLTIPVRKTNDWKITQKITTSSAEEINRQIVEGIKNGQPIISFELHPDWSMEALRKILADINLDSYSFFIDDKELTIPFIYLLKKWAEDNSVPISKITGFIGSDPFHYFFNNYPTHNEAEKYYQEWSNTISFATREFPALGTIFINGKMYKEAGGSAVEQLAYTLAAMVENIERLGSNGLLPQEVLSKTVVGYSIGSDFFTEIAKLRAARYLWMKLQEAYQIENPIPMRIFAETTMMNKTLHEPYMNLLRAGGEALAAVMGHVDYLRISSFDDPIAKPSSLGKRVSRNIHHILKEEAKLSLVADPSAGSYLVEALTKELIEEAWTLFLQIQDEGGLFSLLPSGKIQMHLKDMQQKQLDSFYNQQTILIGANRYIDLDQATLIMKEKGMKVDPLKMKTYSCEEMKESIQAGAKLGDCFVSGNISEQSFLPLSSCRFTELLESMLFKSKEIKEKSGERPKVSMIQMGTKARHTINFVRDFLIAGGLIVEESGQCNSQDDLIAYINKNKSTAYCICTDKGTDKSINLTELKRNFPDKLWGFASLETESVPSWMDEYDFVIHPNVNHIEELEKLLNGIGGVGHEA